VQTIVVTPIIVASLLAWPDNTYLSILVSFSRYARVYLSALVLLSSGRLGKTEVDRQMMHIMITLLLLIYIATGTFTDVENQEKIRREKDDIDEL